MTKEQLLAMGLTEEQAGKVLETSAEELKGYIPKARFDEVNTANKDLKQQVSDRDKQLEELKKAAGSNEEMQQQIKQLQDDNKAKQAEYEANLKQLKIDSSVELALTAAKARNTKAVKALLDLSQVELDGDTVKGLEDQIKKLTEAEDSKFLFETKEPNKPNFSGAKPPEGSDQTSSSATPATLTDAIKMHFETKG